MNLHLRALGVPTGNGVSVLFRERIGRVSAAVILAADLIRVDNISAVRSRGTPIMCLDVYLLYRRWHHWPIGAVGKSHRSPKSRPRDCYQQRDAEQGQKR